MVLKNNSDVFSSSKTTLAARCIVCHRPVGVIKIIARANIPEISYQLDALNLIPESIRDVNATRKYLNQTFAFLNRHHNTIPSNFV